jgi:hypothetical protein
MVVGISASKVTWYVDVTKYNARESAVIHRFLQGTSPRQDVQKQLGVLNGHGPMYTRQLNKLTHKMWAVGTA